MITPKTAFRLGKDLLKLADKLLENPPAVVIDSDMGRPRDRTELIKNLLRYAAKVQAEENAKGQKR